jgi:hypothetical protein
MKLHFEQVGGIAGQQFISDVDTESLSERDRKKLYSIFQKSKVLDVQIPSQQTSDVFHYKLTVDHKAEFDSPTVPRQVKALLAFLMALQNPQARKESRKVRTSKSQSRKKRSK